MITMNGLILKSLIETIILAIIVGMVELAKYIIKIVKFYNSLSDEEKKLDSDTIMEKYFNREYEK